MGARNILYIISFLFLLTSCDFITKAYKETFAKQKETNESEMTSGGGQQSSDNTQSAIEKLAEAEAVNLLENAENLDRIQQQLRDMFPEKSLEIFPPHIYFDTERIRLQLVDPDITENVDWYYYMAETESWEKEDPVKIRIHEQRNSIPLEAIQFSTANAIYRQLIEKAASVEGAEAPTSLNFSFHLPEWNWNARIYGSRADYDFEANKDGEEIAFKRL